MQLRSQVTQSVQATTVTESKENLLINSKALIQGRFLLSAIQFFSLIMNRTESGFNLYQRPCLHSCYYEYSFYLRTSITINGSPTVVEIDHQGDPVLVTAGKSTSISCKLATISLKAVGPVIIKHGVYHIDSFFNDQSVPGFLIKFRSISSLERLLNDCRKEFVQNELALHITKVICSVSQRPEASLKVQANVQVYLLNLCLPQPKPYAINLSNYQQGFKRWENSKLFEFNQNMFEDCGINIGKTEVKLMEGN